jgi:chromosome segregation ATPase
MEHREAVEEWRQRQRNPSSLNNPDHVWRGFQKSAYWQDRRDANRKPSRLEVALAAALAHIEELDAVMEPLREEIERQIDALERSAELIEQQWAEIKRLRMQRLRPLTRSYRSKTG